MKKNVKNFIAIGIVVLIIISMIVLIYFNLFADSSNSRYKEINKYNLSNDEINSAKSKLEEIENVKNISIYTNSKIIKIMVTLSDDTDFSKIKKISNEVLSNFKEENLSYYDVEIFIKSEKKDSEKYPKIGYKHKTKKEFTW